MLLAQANAFYSFKSILIHSSGGLHTGVGKRRATGHTMVDKRAVQEMWSKGGHLVSTNALFRAARSGVPRVCGARGNKTCRRPPPPRPHLPVMYAIHFAQEDTPITNM